MHPHHEAHDQHPQAHGHLDEHRWSDETFVADWAQRQEANLATVRPLFAKVGALIPREPTESFRYLDLGAGAGYLDEAILDRFTGAQAVLVDGSAPLLAHAQKRLARFTRRASSVQVDLSDPGWVEQVQGSFDAVVSARAVHHFGGADRIRALYAEIRRLLAPGGLFINLDFVPLASPTFQQLGEWADRDPAAAFPLTSSHMQLPGSVEDQLTWLREAGFAAADCLYREFQTVIIVGIRDQVILREGARIGQCCVQCHSEGRSPKNP